MPFAFAGLQINANQGFAEQIITGAMAAVEVTSRRFNRQVDQAELLVHSDLGPDAGVSGVFCRAIIPSVVAKLTLFRNGVKDPEAFAGSNVEAAHITFVVAHAFGRHALAKSGADDYGIFGHDRRGLNAYFASDQIRKNFLIVIQLQIHFAMIGKRGNSNASLGVQTDQAKSRRDVENSLFFAVRPIGQAAAGELPWSCAAAFSFMLTVDPKQFTGGRVKSDDRAARSSSGVQNAVHHERRAFEFVLQPVAEIIGLDAPRNFKIIEVAGVDLIQRPVTSTR